MATTQQDIRGWLEAGKAKGATHVIVVCDTYDHSDYPVCVMPGEDPQKMANEYQGQMQRVMEVYALHLPWNAQLCESRAFHYDAAPVATAPRPRPAKGPGTRRARPPNPKLPEYFALRAEVSALRIEHNHEVRYDAGLTVVNEYLTVERDRLVKELGHLRRAHTGKALDAVRKRAIASYKKEEKDHDDK